MKQHRILIATDVPFWRKSTGAQTRINSLVEFLIAESFVVRTFYLGQTGSERYTEKDQQLIAELELDVEQQSSDQIPKSWSRKIAWYAHQIRPKLSSNLELEKGAGQEENDRPAEPDPLRLEDFRWPWASQAFSESIGQFKPDSILIEYVKLGYLIDCLSSQQRNSIHCVIDTHDALHIRCEKFKERGFKHWLEISREEEARELDKFDTVIAIQPNEAELFQKMAPRAKTIVCGHALSEVRTETSNVNKQSTNLSIGYLGSTNSSNAQAIEKFLDSVWIPVNQNLNQRIDSGPVAKIELVIGGSICQHVAQYQGPENNHDSNTHLNLRLLSLRLLGHVDELADFYGAVDVIINPVEFGTGLKIKSVEGLAFGKPLISTPQGIEGLEQLAPSTEEAIVVCETADEFMLTLEQLATNSSRLQSLKNAAAMLAKSAFSQQQAYSALKRTLLRGK